MIYNVKNEDGISIVAVIAVIIVLLILAGVGISQLGGTDGILEESKKSVSTYAEKSIREQVEMKILDLNIEKLGNATLEDVLNLKETDSDITNTYKSGDKVILIINGYKCEINENLEVGTIEEYDESEEEVKSIQSQKQVRAVRRIVTVDTADMFERQVEE